MMKKIYLTAFLLALYFGVFSQTSCPMEVGSNLGSIDSQVFKDLKKSSTHFFTTNSVYLAGDPNDWDTQLIDLIPTDASGYPTINIPFSHSSVDTTQIYHFLVGIDSIYPTGSYELLYDGTGTLSISTWSNAENINYVSAGRITFDVLTTTSAGIHVEVRASQASDHIRNIRIVHVDDLSSYETQPFRNELIDLSSEFACLRFMDWCGTNELYYDVTTPYNNTPLTWAERVTETQHRFTDEEGGLSYEDIIKFANATQKDVWVNIPHRADSNYIYQMASLFHTALASNIVIHLEFSNEVWNSIFQQTDYVENEGPHSGIGYNYGYFAGKAFQIWKSVYGADRNRLRFVLAGHDWTVLDALSITNTMNINIDEASYPGYFNLGDAGWANLDALGAATTVQDIVTQAQNNMSEDFYWMKQFKDLVCTPNNLDFVIYEGGQHLLRLFGVEEVFQDALYQTQVSTQMQDLYTDMLSYCRDSLDVKLFNHFNLYGPNESTFGSWGMIESIYETPNTSKYLALKSFMCENEDTTIVNPPNPPGTAIEEITSVSFTVFPNPANEYLNIVVDESIISVTIYDLNGKEVLQSNENKKINSSSLSSGFYFLKLKTETGLGIKKIVIN